MGLFRKITSIGTVGLVDFRSDKERTAAYTRSTRNAARKQNRILRKQGRPVVNNYYATPQPVMQSAGWHYAQGDPPGSVRYWDGQQWTGWFKP